MKITELQAYKRLEEMFEEKGYSQGVKDKMPIYCWDDVRQIPHNLTPGHYVDALSYGRIGFENIPKEYRTREFFLHSLCSAYMDVVEYVKTHLEEFDKQFFKDHIATNYYGIEFELNDFDFMPIEYIDEEMVACAMFRSINMRYVDRRGDCEQWFYSVYRRKPELLSYELYVLGARCFGAKGKGKNKFLDITPEKFRTEEYYFALCLKNDTPVMEDIPEHFLTTNFLVRLLNDTMRNIKCFTEDALEREVFMSGEGVVKIWQAAIIDNGMLIRDLPLNEERIEFFLSLYDKDSFEYEFGFKDHYKRYLRKKNATAEPRNDTTEFAGAMTLLGALFGMGNDAAIDMGTEAMNKATNRNVMLPINYNDHVPKEYSKKYDGEEYLLEIYKKIGVQVLREVDSYFFAVVLPENIRVEEDNHGYCVKNSEEEILIHYYDRGSFYDRSVTVDQINITL